MHAPDDNRTVTPSPIVGEGAPEAAMLDMVERLDVCLIDPAYSLRDACGLTGVSSAAVRRWLSGYPPGVREVKARWINENDKRSDALLVSFLELVEILVAGKLKAATGKSFAGIRKYNIALSSEWETYFPFAHRNMLKVSDALPDPVVKTLAQMEYDNGFVSRWLPFGKDGSLALDSIRAGGQPAIKGRRVRVVDITGQFRAGHSIKWIADDFDIRSVDVEQALRYAMLLGA